MRLTEEYAARDDSADPRAHQRRHAAAREELQDRFLAGLPRAQRPAARLVLRLASTRIPLRGLVKRSFLQALDVGRAAGAHMGSLMHQDGTIASPDDVHYLTVEELTTAPPSDIPSLVSARRQRRAIYQTLVPLTEWTGAPVPVAAASEPNAGSKPGTGVIQGIGVSTGVIEGTARVVISPDDDIELQDILIAPFTDPSWSSLLFLASALVVDIGGAFSHAAVVAREMDVPCVVNTRTGTIRIRSGDRIRVDGTRGTVEILERAQRTSLPETVESALSETVPTPNA